MSVFTANKNVYLIIFKLHVYDIKFKKYLEQRYIIK